MQGEGGAKRTRAPAARTLTMGISHKAPRQRRTSAATSCSAPARGRARCLSQDDSPRLSQEENTTPQADPRGSRVAASALQTPDPAEIEVGKGPERAKGRGVDLHCYEQMDHTFVGFKPRAASTSQAVDAGQDAPASAGPAAKSAGATVGKRKWGLLASYGDLSETSFARRPSVLGCDDLGAITSKLFFSGVERAAADKAQKKIATSGPRALVSYPMDWSLKKNARITSPAPLDWVVEYRNRHSLPSHLARSLPPSGPASVDLAPSHNPKALGRALHGARRGEEPAELASERCCEALLQWQHPVCPLPPMMEKDFRRFNDLNSAQAKLQAAGTAKNLTAMASKTFDSNADWFRRRSTDFEAAFSSLWALLRDGRCRYFYYVGQRSVVLFVGQVEGSFGDESAGCGVGAPSSAYVTSSSKNFRDELEEHGIEYTTPLQAPDPVVPDEHEAGLGLDESSRGPGDEDTSSRGSWGLKGGSNMLHGGVSSLLCVQGDANVHGLYNLLLETPHRNDVPTLLSPTSFTFGSLVPVRVQVKSATLHSRDVKAEGKEVHTLEVDGPVLPCRMQALVHALMLRQEIFNVQFITDSRSLGLNGAIEQREIGVAGEQIVVQRLKRTCQGLFLTTGAVGG